MEAAFPYLSELVEPLVNFFHFMDIEPVKYFPARPLLRYQLALSQYTQVLGNGLPAGIEMRCQSIRCLGLHSKKSYNFPPGWVGYGLKNIPSHKFKHSL